MTTQPRELQYDDLNGSEALEVLHTRFYDFLHTIPEFHSRFALTRVILRLQIAVDIWGASSKKIYHDQVKIESQQPPPSHFETQEAHYSKEAIIDSRNGSPDEVRADHGLSLPRSIRGQAGMMETQYLPSSEDSTYTPPPPPKTREALPPIVSDVPVDEDVLPPLPAPLPPQDLPANQPGPNMRVMGKRKFAAWVEQDQGSVMTGDRKGNEGPIIGGDKIAHTGGGSSPAPVQIDFRLMNLSGNPEEVVKDTIERGHKIDQELEDQLKKFRASLKEKP